MYKTQHLETMPLMPLSNNVRHENDVETIKQVLIRELSTLKKVIFLHADICRSDLDVEIEGIASAVLDSVQT